MPLARLDLARQAGLTQFGGQVLYQPAAGGDPFPVAGVYSAPHTVIDMNAPSEISTTAPVLGVDLAAFPAPPRSGDRLTREGVLYRVDDVREDGQGGAELMLHRI